MNNYHKKILLTIIISSIIIFFGNSARAEEIGCCEINPSPGFPRVENLTKSKCMANKVTGADFNSTAVFKANQKVSDDGKSCVDANISKPYEGPSKITAPVLSVSIPGFVKFSNVNCDNPDVPCQIPWLAEYIKALYQYSVIIIGILAVIVVMLGGVLWLTAAGNKERIGSATNFIKGGIMGLIIALGSYALLFILNPNLVILSSINIAYVGKNDLNEPEAPILNGSESDYDEQPDGCPKDNELAKVEGVKCIAGDCRARIKTVEGIKKAEEVASKKKANLEIHSALRDMKTQEALWEKYHHNRALVAKPSCGAPHVRGIAIDVCLKGTGSCKKMGGEPPSNAYYKDEDTDKLQAIMKEAGWIRYCGEWWHFQYQAQPAKPCSP